MLKICEVNFVPRKHFSFSLIIFDRKKYIRNSRNSIMMKNHAIEPYWEVYNSIDELKQMVFNQPYPDFDADDPMREWRKQHRIWYKEILSKLNRNEKLLDEIVKKAECELLQ